MKKEILKKKLDKFLNELKNTSKYADDYTKIHLCLLEKIINEYIRKIEKDELKTSGGGTLGLRRALLEYDNLANNKMLYNLAMEVDSYYSNECNEW